jgi:outer membrane immunogenic protein
MKNVLITMMAGAAFAATATPAAAAATSGFRVEAVAGWDHGSVDLNDFGIDDELNSDGIVFGLGAGYDFAVGTGNSIGIDVEATESTGDVEITDGTDSAEISIGRDLYVGGRFTFAAGSNANVYLKAGYTNARIRATVDDGTGVISDAANADGIRGGIGVQVGVGGNAYVGGEYRYSNYEADFSRHQAVATLGFRF